MFIIFISLFVLLSVLMLLFNRGASKNMNRESEDLEEMRVLEEIRKKNE